MAEMVSYHQQTCEATLSLFILLDELHFDSGRLAIELREQLGWRMPGLACDHESLMQIPELLGPIGTANVRIKVSEDTTRYHQRFMNVP